MQNKESFTLIQVKTSRFSAQPFSRPSEIYYGVQVQSLLYVMVLLNSQSEILKKFFSQDSSSLFCLHKFFPLYWLISQTQSLTNISTTWCCTTLFDCEDGFNKVMYFNLCVIRPEYFISYSLRVHQMLFGKPQAGCQVSLTEKWLLSGHCFIRTVSTIFTREFRISFTV